MSQATHRDAKRRPDWASLVIAAALAAVAVVIAWSTASHGAGASYARVGPTTMPYVIAAAFGCLSIWTAFEALRGEFPQREHQEISPILWIVGGLAAQMLLLKMAGFSIATGLLFAATARAFGRGPLWTTIPIGVALSFVIWVIFARGLQLSLPAGPLEHLF